MMNDKIENTCPNCLTAIPEGAPDGVCPKCIFLAAATVKGVGTPSQTEEQPASAAEIQEHFPEFEVLELLGAGGMGAVYKARQIHLDRMVAIKILSPRLSADPTFSERFSREARVLAKLNHPNIVTVYDSGTQGPFFFLLMEYVDGVNLRQAMGSGGFTSTETLELVQSICLALKFAHEQGVLHRDIKPENVLIDLNGAVKIADFGIAKIVGSDERNDFTLTLQGTVLGSPHYMAPEQIETPGDIDQRADVYSLGVVFYEMLTGELPIGRFAAPSEKSALDPRIDEIVMRTLEKEREARYQNMGDMRTQVQAVTQHPADPTSHTSTVENDAPGTARFSLASGILTALSLVLGLLMTVLSTMLLTVRMSPEKSEAMQQGIPWVPLLSWTVLIFGVFVPAILGFFWGARALGEIRASKGKKYGLGSALFGTLAWPVVFIFLLSGAGMLVLLKTIGISIPSIFALLIPLLIGLAISIHLVRSVSHTTRGGTDILQKPAPSGTKLLIFIGVLVLIILAGHFIGANQPPDPTIPPSMLEDHVMYPGPAIHEEPGSTHAAAKVRYVVPAGQMVSFGLVRIDATGNEQMIVTDWCTICAARSSEATGMIAIDVLNQLVSNANPAQDIVHTRDMNLMLKSASGIQHVRGFSMNGNWTFEPWIEWPSFAGAGEFRLKVASEIPMNWEGAPEEIGRLELVLKHRVNPQPTEMETMDSRGLGHSSE